MCQVVLAVAETIVHELSVPLYSGDPLSSVCVCVCVCVSFQDQAYSICLCSSHKIVQSGQADKAGVAGNNNELVVGRLDHPHQDIVV